MEMEDETTPLYCRQLYRNTIEETISSIPDDCIRVDVLRSIEILKRFEILQIEKCERLTRICSEYSTNKEQLIAFACNLYQPGMLEFLLNILDIIGQSDIANAISTTICRPIHRPKLPHSKHLQTFYYSLKNNIDGNKLFDRAEFLKKKYTEISNSFNRLKNDNYLLKAAGKFAVVTWLLIQHCNRETSVIREVLDGMLERWPERLDDTLAMIFYNSKMAIAAIMDEDVYSAEEYSRIAKHLSASWQDPLTNALICHDSRYTNQRIFEHQGSEKHRKAIFDETITGLCFLESDNNGCELFNRQLKRMFLLYIAQHKLNIHNDLNCRETDLASANDVKFASDAIKCFEGTLDTEIDPRRGMIYMVCKARVHDSRGELSKAMILLYEATKLAGDGALYKKEPINIREYTDRLVLRD